MSRKERLLNIGLYEQVTQFSNEHAGTSEWCIAKKDEKTYFVKKFQSPVYPSKELGLSEKKYNARVARFHSSEKSRKKLYETLRENNTSGVLVIPEEVISFQYHICAVSEYVSGNVPPDQIWRLSVWQKIVLMRTITLALMDVHRAGIVHSDMKPENVLVTQNPENKSCILKMIDFDGCFFEKEAPDSITCDPTYLAPEGYMKETDPSVHLDTRMDIFALGIIFHYFWTGRLPNKESDLTIGQCVLQGKAVSLDPGMPDVLKNIITGALSPDPEKRITLERVYENLGKLLDETPVSLVSVSEKAEKSIKTNSFKEGNKEAKENKGERSDKDDKDAVIEKSKEAASETAETLFDEETKKNTRKIVITVALIALLLLSPILGRRVWVINHYPKAVIAYQSGDYQEAEKLFSRIESYTYNHEYRNSWLYLKLIDSHLGRFYNTEDELDTLLAHRYFEDAQELLKEKKPQFYSEAVQSYREGSYSFARYVFSRLDGYEDSELYADFSRIHLDEYHNYDEAYELLKDHFDFEDAKDLIIDKKQLFERYLLGEWFVIAEDSYYSLTARKDDDGSCWITNLPEAPGGGTWDYDKGIIYYRFEGEERFPLLEVEIYYLDSCTFYSCADFTVYDLYRED